MGSRDRGMQAKARVLGQLRAPAQTNKLQLALLQQAGYGLKKTDLKCAQHGRFKETNDSRLV